MYSVSEYGDMLTDRPRMRAYSRALRQTVRQGSVVADIGTGTGIMALLACRYGARRVFAIEPDSAIEVARAAAQDNGCADRIVFLQELSTRVQLPEPADVIVSDLRGVLPLFEHHLPAIADARRRLLKPGGSLIPLRDTLWAAVIETQRLYKRLNAPWISKPLDLNLRAGQRVVCNTMCKTQARAADLLTSPRQVATLDYSTLEDSSLRAELKAESRRSGTAHGVAVWFDSVLTAGVEFSNAPGAPKMVYGQMFFPFPEPVKIVRGDRWTVSLQADLVGADYVWQWESCVHGQGRASAPRAHFRQSTFWGAPLSRTDLEKREAGYRPTLNAEGEVEHFILSQMDGKTAQEEIARRTQTRFPALFSRWEDALSRAGELARKFSR